MKKDEGPGQVSLHEGWYRLYDEKPFFTRSDLKRTLSKFLEYAGYDLPQPVPVGFMMPDLVALRSEGNRRFEVLFVLGEGINSAVRGFRELAAAKCFRKDAADYVLALPPVSEHHLIEFLIEKEDWFFPIKDQQLQLWLVNPEREKVDCLLGWPRDDRFRHYFSNPRLAGFAGYIANKATEKLLKEEFGP